jgi:hypothetical protein
MSLDNKGFDPAVIEDYRKRMEKAGKNYLLTNPDDNGPEFKNFFFIGMFEGREVLYDAALYTLRLHHNSELYELAEHRAARHFPDFKKIRYKEDENGDLQALDDFEEEIGLFMAEVMMELEEEGDVRVAEFIDLDTNLDFGIGLDAALNVDQINDKVIRKFVNEFNNDTLQLDETTYTFQSEDEEYIKK